MKEAIVTPDTTVSIHEVEIPEPGPAQLLIKVLVSGTNPIDWKVPLWTKTGQNSGDDVAGLVEMAGSNVLSFKKGDRVAGCHGMVTPHGSFAEYAILPAHTTFHIPDNISLEEAATVPMAAFTAAVAIHHSLRLPSPWDPRKGSEGPTPVVVYGASTAIGAFGLKLLKKADIHPIIAVGSKTSSFVTSLLEKDKGDAFVDYTTFESQDKLADELASQLKRTGGRYLRAYDCVTGNGTYDMLGKALVAASPDDGKPILTTVLPGKDYSRVDPKVDVAVTSVGWVFNPECVGAIFAAVWGKAIERGLSEGWFAPHPHEVVNGLEGLEGALKQLREGSVRAKKLVIRIAKGN